MINRTRYFLTTAAAALCFFAAAPAFSDTVTHETVTESSDGTVVKKTVTQTAPAPATVRTTVTETPDGDTVVRKTITRTVPAETAVRTTVTTETPAARAETVWHVDTATGAHVVAFGALDLNRDGILSTYEVGTVLFRLYDTDGNDVIDNIEYQNRVMVTVTPIEKETVISYDFDGDGVADKTQTTYETFMRDTMLARFDANRNGLSAQEFTGRSFLEADINDDKAIDLKEWKGSYVASIDRANKDKARFN